MVTGGGSEIEQAACHLLDVKIPNWLSLESMR
jgi:hypothetical protein